jgi:hypothetical protein
MSIIFILGWKTKQKVRSNLLTHFFRIKWIFGELKSSLFL